MRVVCGVLLLLVVSTEARVHSHINKKNTKTSFAEEEDVADVDSRYHVNTVMDLAERVQELPEQTLPTQSKRVMELEEDEDADKSDPTRYVQEIPEQTIAEPETDSSKGKANLDLERVSVHKPHKTSKKQSRSKAHISKDLEMFDIRMLKCGGVLAQTFKDNNDNYNGKPCEQEHLEDCGCRTWTDCKIYLDEVIPKIPGYIAMYKPDTDPNKVLALLRNIAKACEARFGSASSAHKKKKTKDLKIIPPDELENRERARKTAEEEERREEERREQERREEQRREQEKLVAEQRRRDEEQREREQNRLREEEDRLREQSRMREEEDRAKGHGGEHGAIDDTMDLDDVHRSSLPIFHPITHSSKEIAEGYDSINGGDSDDDDDDGEVESARVTQAHGGTFDHAIESIHQGDSQINEEDSNEGSEEANEPEPVSVVATAVTEQQKMPHPHEHTPGIQLDHRVGHDGLDDPESREVVQERAVAQGAVYTEQGADGYYRTNYRNPLLDVSKPEVSPVEGQNRVAYNKAEDKGRVELDTGDFHLDIRNNKGQNFLDANRVQIGTARLGARPHAKGSTVAKFRIRFANQFARRPIVIVTTVPASAELVESMGVHPDVFAASVAEIRLDSFIVNVVRLDSMPNNSWGQELFLDWIAMEYDSEYPKAAPPLASPLSVRHVLPMTMLEEAQTNGSAEGEFLGN